MDDVFCPTGMTLFLQRISKPSFGVTLASLVLVFSAVSIAGFFTGFYTVIDITGTVQLPKIEHPSQSDKIRLLI